MYDFDENAIRKSRFLSTPPFYHSKKYVKKYDCDLAVPNGDGIGNIICYTRLVEEYAMELGRPLKLLTAPLNPIAGVVKNESLYPIWDNNPFLASIINADEIDTEIMKNIVLEQDNYCQFNHFIENLCANSGLRPRKLRPSLYLTVEEMRWGINFLSKFKRPIICLHPSGNSASSSSSPWFENEWRDIIDFFNHEVSFIQLGKYDHDTNRLNIPFPETTLREAMALIWSCDIFIGFDSGLAHVATAFEKPALILWDSVKKSKMEECKEHGFSSAVMMRWSYPQNRNLMILGEKDHEISKLCKEFIFEKISHFYRFKRLTFLTNHPSDML
jgi:hypothetical protein